MLAPIVAEEERRAGAHVVRTGRAVRVRDEVGVRALNDALRSAFDAPGSAGFPGTAEENDAHAILGPAMRFKQSPVRLRPGEARNVSLIVSARIPPSTPIAIQADPGIRSSRGIRPSSASRIAVAGRDWEPASAPE